MHQSNLYTVCRIETRQCTAVHVHVCHILLELHMKFELLSRGMSFLIRTAHVLLKLHILLELHVYY